MLTKNVYSGVSAQVDQERAGMRCIDRTFSELVSLETKRAPLAAGTAARSMIQGGLCSLTEHGDIQPFDTTKPFAGFLRTLIQEDEIKAVIDSRGSILLHVNGLQAASIGKPVHAVADGRFSMETGGAIIGELLAIENLEGNTAVVGFRRLDDLRPFDVGGRLMERGRFG